MTIQTQAHFASTLSANSIGAHRRRSSQARPSLASIQTSTATQPQFSGFGSALKKGIGTVALLGGGLVALLTGMDMGIKTVDRIQEDRPLIEDGENALSQYGEQIGFLIGGAGVSAAGGKLSRQADNEA